MNAPHPKARTLAQDYVFGALSPPERAEVARARLSDRELDREILDAERVFAPLTEATGEMTPSEGLLDRITGAIAAEAEAMAGKVALGFDEGHWLPFKPGIQVKRLWGKTAVLLRCEPGAVLPAHDHADHEHIVVVAGDFVVGGRSFGPGDYHGSPAGSGHADAFTRGGCVLLVQSAA